MTPMIEPAEVPCRHVQRMVAEAAKKGVKIEIPPWEITCLECVNEQVALIVLGRENPQ